MNWKDWLSRRAARRPISRLMLAMLPFVGIAWAAS
jgi:hypothetical protein